MILAKLNIDTFVCIPKNYSYNKVFPAAGQCWQPYNNISNISLISKDNEKHPTYTFGGLHDMLQVFHFLIYLVVITTIPGAQLSGALCPW